MPKASKTRKRHPRGVQRGSKQKLKLEVESGVARDISAIIYFALAAVTVLSLQGNFGVVGSAWVSLLKPVLGFGVYGVPVVFFVIALMLFFAKEVRFGFTRAFGLVLFGISVLSIVHLSVPIDDIFDFAQAGRFGGYTGFVTNFLFREILGIGHLGSSIVFVALLIISLLLTFNVSLKELGAALNPQMKLLKKAVKAKEAKEEKEFSPEAEKEPAVTIMRTQITAPETEKEEVVTIPIEDEVNEDEVKPLEEASLEAKPEVADETPYEFPLLDLLSPPAQSIATDEAYLRDNADRIRGKFKEFDIEVTMHEVNVGPTVIQYTLRPHEGVKLSKLVGLKNDIALALAAKAVRIEAPIPGKSLVGIEIPNDHRTNVHLREMLESKEYGEMEGSLKLPIGRDVSGRPVIGNLEDMPHILIAGATGSGKSVGMNTFLLSLLYQNTPKDLRLILIDPKRVELNHYNNLPHLLTPVITEPEKAAIALRWVVTEMQRRYKLLSASQHRNINEYNGDPEVFEKLPKVVVVVDELADLMMMARAEVEASICRIAQMARAVGMHLIIATQRPSVDIITGLIKANIPSRIAYAVSSSVDSRTILDAIGAEDLLGKGDLLYLPSGLGKFFRVQGVYVTTAEIERVTNFIKLRTAPDYADQITSQEIAEAPVMGIPDSEFAAEEDDDKLMKIALQVVVEERKASASLLQRRLKLGYARAARLLDMMEGQGLIGPVRGAKPRDIYFDKIHTAI